MIPPVLAAEECPLLKEIEQYEAASPDKKIAIANELFEKHFVSRADTILVFDCNSDLSFMDAVVYYWSADAAYAADCYQQSVLWNLQAEEILSKTDSIEYYSDCLALTACNYVRLGDFESASSYSDRVIELDRKIGDPNKISSSLNTAAAIWLYSGNPSIAERYILEALDIERQLNKPSRLAIRLGMASEIFVKENKLDEGLKYAEEALKAETEGGNPKKIAVRQSQLGSALIALKRFEEAREICVEAAETLRSTEQLTSLSITLRQLATIEREQGNDNLAIDFLKQALAISDTLQDRYQMAGSYHQLAEMLKDVDPRQAIEYMERYVKINEEMFNEKMTRQLQSFEVKYQNVRQQHLLDVQSAHLARHQLLNFVCIGIIIVCIIVACLFASLAKTRGRNNRMLQQASAAKDELLRIANASKLQEDSARQKILEVASHISSNDDSIEASHPEVELTSRELQIVKLYSQGLLSKEVAERLDISVRTVETHKNHIYRKLGISTTVELLRYAEQKGLV